MSASLTQLNNKVRDWDAPYISGVETSNQVYIKGGDARWEFSNEPLKGTNLGVA